MNNEREHDHEHDHEHHQGRSLIARQPYRPPPCEADDNEAEAAARRQDEARAHAAMVTTAMPTTAAMPTTTAMPTSARPTRKTSTSMGAKRKRTATTTTAPAPRLLPTSTARPARSSFPLLNAR